MPKHLARILAVALTFSTIVPAQAIGDEKIVPTELTGETTEATTTEETTENMPAQKAWYKRPRVMVPVVIGSSALTVGLAWVAHKRFAAKPVITPVIETPVIPADEIPVVVEVSTKDAFLNIFCRPLQANVIAAGQWIAEKASNVIVRTEGNATIQPVLEGMESFSVQSPALDPEVAGTLSNMKNAATQMVKNTKAAQWTAEKAGSVATATGNIISNAIIRTEGNATKAAAVHADMASFPVYPSVTCAKHTVAAVQAVADAVAGKAKVVADAAASEAGKFVESYRPQE